MHKFFVNKENISEDKITITGDDVKHIGKVLRLRTGDIISISNGEGLEFTSIIDSIDKKEVLCTVKETLENKTESKLNITLFQGLPKSQKMDLIVQKGVEIGINRINPVITKRVVVKTEKKDISNKIERWNKIALEASKQSGRGKLLKVENPIDFKKAADSLEDFDLIIVPYENKEDIGLKNVLSKSNKDYKNIAIFIGPEGGFEEEEIEYLLSTGAHIVTLGPRILRTETAGFVTSTILLYELGDMGGKF